MPGFSPAVFWGQPIGLRVSILASGSSGNITLLETSRTRLLIDCGLGKRETLARLAAIEQTVAHVDGILITHEHTDHCNGLPQMLALWKAPLFVTEPTMDAMNRVLSNFLAAPEGFAARARYLALAHLSQENTTPDLARLSAEEALNRRPAVCAFHGELLIASQDKPLRPIEL